MMRCSAIKPTRLDSASEMPGLKSILMVKRAFVEGRQEGARQEGTRRAPATATASSVDAMQRTLMAKGTFEQRCVTALEYAHQSAVAMLEPLEVWQHVIGHHRRQRDRDHEAGEDRNDVGFAERREQPPLDSRQGKQRHEHQDDDRRRIDDAGSHLLRGRDDHVEGRSRICQRAVFAQMPEDVLDIDNGVIDQFADGDGETAQRHGVDGQPEQSGRSRPWSGSRPESR